MRWLAQSEPPEKVVPVVLALARRGSYQLAAGVLSHTDLGGTTVEPSRRERVVRCCRAARTRMRPACSKRSSPAGEQRDVRVPDDTSRRSAAMLRLMRSEHVAIPFR